jgi:MFS family permease
MVQMALIALEANVPNGFVPLVLSCFAVSVLVGRLGSGWSLDRFPTNAVASIAMVLPAIGCLLLFNGGTSLELVVAGVVLVGLSQGSESDLGAFIVAQHFPHECFGTAMGSVNAAVVTGTAFGIMLFGQSFDLTQSYDLPLALGCGFFLLGAIIFWMIKERSNSAPIA